MSVWENIPECKRESINKSLYRFDRIQKRKDKIKRLFNVNSKKSDNLIEPGYVYAPYIPMTTSQVIVDYGSKNISRKRKINNIFDLGLDVKDEFSPSKSIMSRYSKKTINAKYYGTIEIKNPTY
jgi:hypothetical protein